MKNNGSIIFDVDTDIYPLEAVYAASYVFTPDNFVKITGTGRKNSVSVEIRSKNSNCAVIRSEFYNELLHHALRLKISERNSGIRERIVLQALSSAVRTLNKSDGSGQQKKPVQKSDTALEKEIEKLLKEAEAGSYKKDPLEIAVPWEKKNKKAKK